LTPRRRGVFTPGKRRDPLTPESIAARARELKRRLESNQGSAPDSARETIESPSPHPRPRHFSPFAHRAFVLFILAGDLGAVLLGILLAALMRFPAGSLGPIFGTAGGAALLTLGSVIWIAFLSARGAYWPSVTLYRGYQAMRVISAGVPAWIFVQLLAFWLKDPAPFESRLVVAMSLPITLLGLVAFRLLLVRPLATRVYKRLSHGPVLVLGESERSMRMADDLEMNDRRRRKITHHALSSMDPGLAEALVEERGAGEVIIDPDMQSPSEVLEIAFACLDAGAEVRIISAESRMVVRRPENGGVGGLPVMRIRRRDLSGPEIILKRFVDLAGSAIGLVLLAPVFALLAAAVKLSSPGPVIFKQERIGWRGRPFHMFKFRTMRDGNDPKANHDYLRTFIREGRPAEVTEEGVMIFKAPRDPRVTSVGAWIRKLSLDELPQLYNVLLGDMSLVGPRPCLPYEWELYEPWQKRRLDVLPGCTGLWQVTGRSRVRFEDMVILDLYYAHHGTLLSDLRLIAQTFPVMAQGRGAY